MSSQPQLEISGHRNRIRDEIERLDHIKEVGGDRWLDLKKFILREIDSYPLGVQFVHVRVVITGYCPISGIQVNVWGHVPFNPESRR